MGVIHVLYHGCYLGYKPNQDIKIIYITQSLLVVSIYVQLEVEVDTLKYRLDGLRKAKNTTIVRREREEVRISSPKLGRHRSSTPTPHPPPTPTPNGCHDNKVISELKAEVGMTECQCLLFLRLC